MHVRRSRSVSPPPVAAGDHERIEIDAAQLRELSSAFAPPRWLRDFGRSAWLAVGVFALVAGLVWLLGTTSVIVGPVVVAGIVATVTSPIVAALARHMPRAAAAAMPNQRAHSLPERIPSAASPWMTPRASTIQPQVFRPLNT